MKNRYLLILIQIYLDLLKYLVSRSCKTSRKTSPSVSPSQKSCRAPGQGCRLLHECSETKTYWASSGMRTGWCRLWRPPRRRAAGATGSGRSARKTGRRAPSARSGCRLSDCFLKTHTHIYRHRRGDNGQAGFSWTPTTPTSPPTPPKTPHKDETWCGNSRGPPAGV